MVLNFNVASLCNVGFTICGSYIEQVCPPLFCTLMQGCTTRVTSEDLHDLLMSGFAGSSRGEGPWGKI